MSDPQPHTRGLPPHLHGRIGHQIRTRSGNRWRRGEWARIVAVVPSRGRSCWMVEFGDGATDVWPIHHPDNDYEFEKHAEDVWRSGPSER